MNELFSEEEMHSISPRQKWIAKYAISLRSEGDLFIAESDLPGSIHYGSGLTENNALEDYAKRNNRKLWNEE